MNKINEFLKLIEEIEQHKKEVLVQSDSIVSESVEISNAILEEVTTEEDIVKQNNLAEFLKLLNEIDRQKKESIQHEEESIIVSLNEIEEVKVEEQIVQEENKIEVLTNHFNKLKRKKQKLKEQAPIDALEPLNQKFVTVEDLNKHYNTFLQRIQQQLSSLGGGGEVLFRYLDDVNRATMTANDNNHVLEYDAATGKVQFTDEIGPISHIHFDLDHTHEEERLDGTLCWDPNDRTLNLTHPGGVTQQIGQESYALVRNKTGSLIQNGAAVMFAGAEPDTTTTRLLVAPLIANGTFPSLHGLGIATQDIPDGEDGLVTVWGKVRDVNTFAFSVGDILYADPNNPGGLTNVKPTAPNNVIPFGAVLASNTEFGEIFVRPTIEQRQYYGRFSKLTNATANGENVATPIVFETVDIANGIVINGPANTQIQVADSGFYQFDLSAQLTATSNKGVIYFWFKKNGNDIPHSMRSSTVTNGDTFHFSATLQISLNANDHVEIYWARSAAGIILDATAATAFGPSTPSATINVTQIQL
jgi:hypothetical protein